MSSTTIPGPAVPLPRRPGTSHPRPPAFVTVLAALLRALFLATDDAECGVRVGVHHLDEACRTPR